MSQKIQEMYQKNIIDKYERDTYMLFEINENGREYLKNMLIFIALEQPQMHQFENTFAWHDGKRSCWRDISILIGKVNLQLEDYLNDERSKYTDDPNRYATNELGEYINSRGHS